MMKRGGECPLRRLSLHYREGAREMPFSIEPVFLKGDRVDLV
jgi:hypothetical protein